MRLSDLDAESVIRSFVGLQGVRQRAKTRRKSYIKYGDPPIFFGGSRYIKRKLHFLLDFVFTYKMDFVLYQMNRPLFLSDFGYVPYFINGIYRYKSLGVGFAHKFHQLAVFVLIYNGDDFFFWNVIIRACNFIDSCTAV